MQKQTVFFSINILTRSAHQGYDINNNFVGMAECTGDHRHLSKIEVKKLYIGCDLDINDTPLAYTELEFDVEGFEDSPAGKKIIADICERFGTDNDEPADAVSVCDYYQKRRELEWAKQLQVTHIK